MIEIYTDGACRNNGQANAQGGWGVFVPSLELGFSGGVLGTTNNRMEMTACLEALRLAKTNNWSQVRILTDSKYVVDGLTSWLSGWKRRGTFEPSLKNFDLWVELDKLFTEIQPELAWVRGHSGNEGNERADELSVFGIDNRATKSHNGVSINLPFGKADRISKPVSLINKDCADSTQVVSADEDLTELFDEFEQHCTSAGSQVKFEPAAVWERTVIGLVVHLSKFIELQLELNPKKARQALKVLHSLTTRSQEFMAAQQQSNSKQINKASSVLDKAILKSEQFLEKPATKKLLG